MKNRILLAFIGIVSITILAKCKKDKNTEINCSNIVVSYANDIAPLLTTECNTSGCHRDNFSAGDFTTYSGIKAKANNGSLRSEIINKSMPINGSLSDTEIQKIVCWIESGALEN